MDPAHLAEPMAGQVHVDIIYSGDDLVVVNKPPNVITSGDDVSMDMLLRAHLKQTTGAPVEYLTHCHQLDAPTSGACSGSTLFSYSRRLYV